MQLPLGNAGPRILGEEVEKSTRYKLFSSPHGGEAQLENVLVPRSHVPATDLEENKYTSRTGFCPSTDLTSIMENVPGRNRLRSLPMAFLFFFFKSEFATPNPEVLTVEPKLTLTQKGPQL